MTTKNEPVEPHASFNTGLQRNKIKLDSSVAKKKKNPENLNIKVYDFYLSHLEIM